MIASDDILCMMDPEEEEQMGNEGEFFERIKEILYTWDPTFRVINSSLESCYEGVSLQPMHNISSADFIQQSSLSYINNEPVGFRIDKSKCDTSSTNNENRIDFRREAEKILKHRYERGNKVKFLLKWREYDIETYETAESAMRFPDKMKEYLTDLSTTRKRAYKTLLFRCPIVCGALK